MLIDDLDSGSEELVCSYCGSEMYPYGMQALPILFMGDLVLRYRILWRCPDRSCPGWIVDEEADEVDDGYDMP